MGTREIRLIGPKELLTIVDEKDYRTLNLGSYKWYANIGRSGNVYAQTYKNGKIILLHRFIMGLESVGRSILVDHKDCNGLNNSRTNLRTTDNSGNRRNSRKQLLVKTSSSYKGVYRYSHNKTNPWQAYITLSGKRKHLGYYRTEIEAAKSYNQAASRLFGPMAHLNDLPDQ